MIYYRVKEAIQKSGLTFRQIAVGAKIDLSTLVRLSQAETILDYNASLRTLDVLCSFLKCRLSDLVDYKSKR